MHEVELIAKVWLSVQREYEVVDIMNAFNSETKPGAPSREVVEFIVKVTVAALGNSVWPDGTIITSTADMGSRRQTSIVDIGPRQPSIVDTGPRQPLVDTDAIAQALGAERVPEGWQPPGGLKRRVATSKRTGKKAPKRKK